MTKIEITDDGKVFEKKELDGQSYFANLEEELLKVESQIEFLTSVKEKIKEKLQLKSVFIEKKQEIQENESVKKGMIIGNVTDGGKNKVYHLPSDEGYDSVEFDKERGDMLFKTEKEAISAGFVAKENNSKID